MRITMDKVFSNGCLFNLFLLLPLCHGQPNFAALLGLGGFGEFSETQVAGSGSCPYQPHPDRTKFTQVVNNRVMTQDCAPGTMFVLSKCSCDNIPSGIAGPGSNPRLQSPPRAGNNPRLESLMNQFQGGPGLMLNQHMKLPQVTSGIRPDQNPSGVAFNVQKAMPSPDSGIQYNPDPTTSGLTSVVDPSILPNVLPPEILSLLQRSNASPEQNSPQLTSRSQSSSRSTANTGSSSPSRQNPPPLIPPLSRTSGAGTDNTQTQTQSQKPDLPPEVLKMVQRAMTPPTPRLDPSGSRSSVGSQTTPTRRSPTSQRAVLTQTQTSRSRTPNPEPSPSQGFMADAMARLSSAQGTSPTVDPRSGPREDPLAALLAGLLTPPGASNRGTSRGPSRTPAPPGPSRTPRIPPVGSSGPPVGDPFAALMAGLTSGGSTGSGSSDPMVALMGSMGGSMFGGSGSGDMSSLLAGLGGRPGSPSAPGGPLDVTSLQGNINVGTLLGETPGPGLATNLDMTSLFNEQGRLGVGGGLAGLSNLNLARLQQLDRQGVIDLSDLTPAGLAAANAHFG